MSVGDAPLSRPKRTGSGSEKESGREQVEISEGMINVSERV